MIKMKKFYTTILMMGMLFGLAQATKAETYKAWGSVLFPYISTPMYDDGETLEVTADSIFFSSATWGDGAFAAATGEGVLAMANHRTGGITEYAADIKGSVEEGYVITVPSVMGGTVITVTLGEMPAVYAIAGSYKGGIYTNSAYFSQYEPTADQTVTIAPNADELTASVSATFPSWGTFTFEAGSVTVNEDGSYALAGEGNSAMPGMADPSVVTNRAADFTGTITTDRVLVAEFAVPAVMGGTTVMFNPADFEAVSVKSVVKTMGSDENAPIYNLSGVRVDASYKGIVIKNGKKYLQK